MAHRTHYSLDASRSETKIIFGKMTGAGAANMTYVDGDVLTATRTDTGDYTLAFKHKYPQGLVPYPPGIVGTTEGLMCTFKTWDPAAGTAAVTFAVGSTPTDPAATDSIRWSFAVRNSNAN